MLQNNLTSEQKIEAAKKLIAEKQYDNIQLADNQFARLLKDLDFSDNEIIVETGCYIQ